MNRPKTRRIAFTTLTVTLAGLIGTLTPAFADDDDNGRGAARLGEALERALAARPQSFQFTTLRNLTVQPPIGAEGAAFLIRSKNSLTAQIMAADLQPGHAYTFWWVIFNKPENCAGSPCALSDRATAEGATLYGSGGIAGANGALNVTFTTTSGGAPEGAQFATTLPQPSLMANRGFKAEVHLVTVDHGVPAASDLSVPDPDVPGTWAWELTHSLPFGPAWVRGAIFRP